MSQRVRSRKRNLTNIAGSRSHVFSFDALIPPTVDAPINNFVDCVSADNRRVYREMAPLDPPSPLKRARREAPQCTSESHSTFVPEAEMDMAGDRYAMGIGLDDTLLPDTQHDDSHDGWHDNSAPRMVKPADPAMRTWMLDHRDSFLHVLLWGDGCGEASTSVCPGCCAPGKEPRLRCRDCQGGVLLCADCCVEAHLENPLHIVEEWNGVYFVKVALKNFGLRVQFRHPPRQKCAVPVHGYSEFTVLHHNGIHEVAVDFCGCERREEFHLQLLRSGWYPSTTERPQTCATVACLDQYLALSQQSKTTAYDFYGTLEYLTDGTGLKPPSRYQATAAGELAIRCPVCPRPGVNLPENWESASPEDRCRYVLFLALDACFRLKRRMVLSHLKDPGLGTGWAYMVEWAPYREYLMTVTDQEEMSTCSGLAALDYANTKFSRGYSSTGVGMGVCARHEFVQPNAVGDLQCGERFANMDYIFASLLRHLDPRLRKILSYNIVCQWWKNLKERLLLLPPLMRLNFVLELFRFVVLKMHIHRHTMACQFVGLPALLRRRLDVARDELAKHEETFQMFTAQQVDRVPEWKAQVDAYEANNTLKNPYEATVKGLTETQVRLRLEEEEEKEASAGVLRVHEVSPSGFITMALDLEDQQWRVHVQVELKRAKSTALQINIRTLRRKLDAGIDRLCGLQATFSPASLVALRSANLPPETRSEDRAGGGCMSGLLEIKKQLQDAQCRTSLALLRNQLTIKARFLIYKKNHSRHQTRNTKSRTILARNESKIRLHSEKYQVAWWALVAIANGAEGEVGWDRLRKEDIRCMADPEVLSRNAEKKKAIQARELRRNAELQAAGELPLVASASHIDDEDDDTEKDDDDAYTLGESRRQVSWIWTVAGKTGTDEELEEALCIEWCKAFARTRRWREEIRILDEEWWRLPVTLAYLEKLWKDRAVGVAVGQVPAADAEGMIAYAAKQAAIPAASTAAYFKMEGNDGDIEEEDGELEDMSDDEEFIMDGEFED
ncbi:hypothetical protein GGX14DRAFT_574051 [Mycena pura]|uniref:CxC2-like cysteine cluster KDZ transposase-associated domain-containing protein n=1 Tax=Mycena pura TaxID=153505 RepID=A0AAD6UYL0_9AGAR|nr:hypothetical protein GGX14DRAFT_574051 [Mycena pura]